MRVGIADDAALFREGVELLLGAAGVDVVHSVGDGTAMLEALADDEPDAVLLDMRMPPSGENEGRTVAREIKRRHPGVGVLLFTQVPSARDAVDVLSAAGTSGVGYYSKDSVRDVGHLVEALQRVADGECAVDPGVPSTILGRSSQSAFLQGLTPAERDVVGFMAMGLSNRGIAEASRRREGTVAVHVKNVYQKLGVDEASVDRRVLVVLAALADREPHLPPQG